ncbi:MAG: 2OG-Fe(II) oxygenase [Alphaproteobacteria bacterium]|nr:2OG-Fe(II) oxygenase [Alphaproteobacteria bacterium]
MAINFGAMNAATARRQPPLSPTSGHFLASLGRAAHQTAPFDYWLLDDAFPEDVVDRVADLPFLPPENPLFEGRRECNNSTRVYFSPENQDKFPVCRDLVETFSNPSILAAIERMTHADVSKGQLRIEYCQDVDGFWLEPHLDISVKLFTMLVYLSDDPNLFDAGTDIYDSTPEHRLVASAPYEKNKGLIFVPGTNTWHGFTKRPIKGLRKSIIINYVSPEWRNKDELAYR